MLKSLICIVFLGILTSNLFGQTARRLESEISYFKSGESYADKIDKARLLLRQEPFNHRAIEFTCRYYRENDIDSISLFFDNLIKTNPDKAEPLILRSELLYFEYDQYNRSLYKSRETAYLDSALKIDNQNREALFLLAKLYYSDFIYPFEKEPDFGFSIEPDEDVDSSLLIRRDKIKKSVFKHSADSAVKYLYKLWFLNEQKHLIYFPIRQLECYLDKQAHSQIKENILDDTSTCYFPLWYFANLKENWECDLTMDYLYQISSSIQDVKDLSLFMNSADEPCLYNREASPGYIGFRFTWMRSFHSPVIIRLEKIDNKYVLNWKVGKGQGGYSPKGVQKSGRREINHKEWAGFVRLFNKMKFDSMPNYSNLMMTDGASWVLERKSGEKYKAHNTNWPSKKLKESCLYLLKLTSIKVEEEDVY